MNAQPRGLSQKEFLKYGKEIGLTTNFLNLVWKNPIVSCSVFQAIADREALQRGACQTPRPAPKLEPGYWYCVGGEWEWIPMV